MPFPQLKEETLFVACPGDLQRLRAQIERVARGLMSETGVRIVPYSWDLHIDLEGRGFDQRLSMQKQIPRPADPLCRGVICIVSERIGTALEDDFPLQLLPTVDDWRQRGGGRYYLQHPWPKTDAEQAAALADRAFPLTGTTWEFLDAHASRCPVFLAFVADRQVSPEDASVRFGNNRLYQAKSAALPLVEHQKWTGDTYEPQIRALRNFAGALVQANLESKTYADDDSLIAAIRGFLVDKVFKRPTARGPFRGLDYYGIEDGDLFFGRRTLTDAVVRHIERLADGDITDRFVGFVGPSGCGKSSAMRAGALFELQRPVYRERYNVMAIRPTDFQDANGKPHRIPDLLHAIFVQSTGLATDRFGAARLTRANPSEAIEQLVELIANALPRALDGSKSKLVIGLDQLEEIVDDLCSDDTRREWRPLLEFINRAVRSGHILFIYTLESSREATLASTALAPFTAGRDRHLVANGPEFRHEILVQPFDSMGFRLSAEIEDALRANVEALVKDKTEPEIAALLPLIALTLEKIYEQGAKGRATVRRDAAAFAGIADRFEIDRQMLVDSDLDVRAAIAREADAAFESVESDTLSRGRTLNFFLRPLVRFSESAADAVTLRTAVISTWPSDAQLARQFVHRRLVIAESDNRIRLVHEALLRNWAPAAEWLKTARGELEIESAMRERAKDWSRTGKSRRPTGASAERIAQAALILDHYLRPWAKAKDLGADDEALRDYCLCLLKRSRDPATVIPSHPFSRHVHVAATYGRRDILETFKKLDRSCLDKSRKDGVRPIGSAAWFSPECVEYLLKNKVRVRRADNEGWPPLAIAIYGGNQRVFDLLLPHYDRKSLCNLPDNSTMLHHAARCNEIRMVQCLVEERGLPLNDVGQFGAPLHYAASNGAVDTVRYLLQRADPDVQGSFGMTPLHSAVLAGHLDVVTELLTRCDPNKRVNAPTPPSAPSVDLGRTALHLACASRNTGIVRELLTHRDVDPNLADFEGQTALARATDDSVRRLLLADRRIDPLKPSAKNGRVALAVTIEHQWWDLAKWMIEDLEARGISIAPDLALPQLAIRRGMPIPLLDVLCRVSRDTIDVPSARGETPLMVAAASGSLETVRLVVEKGGANRATITATKGSALLSAILARGSIEVLDTLFTGAPGELTVGDSEGWTPLHAAAIVDHHSAAHWLIERGGENLLERRDNWNRRPFDLAAGLLRSTLSGAEASQEEGRATSWYGDLEWTMLDADREELGRAIGEIDGRYAVSQRSKIATTSLPFYPGARVRLVRVRDVDWGDAAVYFLQLLADDNARLFRLDGLSAPIHEVNGLAPIGLTSDNVLDYLRFFCFFVRAEKGAFLVTESIAQPELAGWTEQKRRDLQNALRSAREWGQDTDGRFRASASVIYGSALFFAHFLIEGGGAITMVRDTKVGDVTFLPMPISLRDVPRLSSASKMILPEKMGMATS